MERRKTYITGGKKLNPTETKGPIDPSPPKINPVTAINSTNTALAVLSIPDMTLLSVLFVSRAS